MQAVGDNAVAAAASSAALPLPPSPGTPVVFIIMGVSGCGKSAVGQQLAQRLRCPFYEGDAFHPAANIAKMRSGTPLDDGDRLPWLLELHGIVRQHVEAGQRAVLSCSALKPGYRDILRRGLCHSSPHAIRSRSSVHVSSNALFAMRGEGVMCGSPGSPCVSKGVGGDEAGFAGAGSIASDGGVTHAFAGGSAVGNGVDCGTAGSSGGGDSVTDSSAADDHSNGTSNAADSVAFALLQPPRGVLQQRLEARAALGLHFMPPALLQSQLDTLCVDDSELLLRVTASGENAFPEVDEIVSRIVQAADQSTPSFRNGSVA